LIDASQTWRFNRFEYIFGCSGSPRAALMVSHTICYANGKRFG
jgi:hypothetical protein